MGYVPHAAEVSSDNLLTPVSSGVVGRALPCYTTTQAAWVCCVRNTTKRCKQINLWVIARMALHAVVRGCLAAASSSEVVALRHGALRHLALSCLTTAPPATTSSTPLVHINAPQATTGLQSPWRLGVARGLSGSATEARLQAARARASKQRAAAAAATAASQLQPPPPADSTAAPAGSDVVPAPAAAVASEPRTDPVEVGAALQVMCCTAWSAHSSAPLPDTEQDNHAPEGVARRMCTPAVGFEAHVLS